MTGFNGKFLGPVTGGNGETKNRYKLRNKNAPANNGRNYVGVQHGRRGDSDYQAYGTARNVSAPKSSMY